MNHLLYTMLAEIECDEKGRPTQEVIMSARDIADLEMQRELDEVEEKLMDQKAKDERRNNE